MIGNRIELYRRHGEKCPYRSQGAHWTRCDCPVWGCGFVAGRKFQASLRTRSWGRAEDRARRICEGELIEEKGITVAQVADAYLADCRYRQIRASTLDSYVRLLNRLTADMGQMELAAVSPDRLGQFLQRRGEVKPRTARKELGYLRMLWNWCIARGHCDRSPAKLIRPPKKPKIHAAPFTAEQVRQLLGAIPQIGGPNPIDAETCRRRVRAAMLLMLWSGLRVSDVAAFRRDAVDKRGRMVVRSRKSDVALSIILPPEVLGALRSLPHISTAYYFWNGASKLKTLCQQLWRSLGAVGRATALHVHPHRFRDTFACRLLEKGVDIRTVSLLLGHDSIKTTEEHYTPWVRSHQKLLDHALSLLDYRAG